MKRKNAYPLIILAIIFLFNPNINLIDVLPDCVAYILLIFAIGSLNESVPYFEECKNALIKLSVVTAIKIPAFVIMYSNMSWGKDIVPLFTLVFSVLELILLYSAIDYAFKALGYIGERTDCTSVRGTYSVGKTKASTPDALKIMTFIFFLSRAILNFLPELLLLTPEDAGLRKKLAEAYPAVLVISVVFALFIGIVWLVQATKFVKYIKRAGDLGAALDSLSIKGTPEELSVKDRLKKHIFSLNLLAFSSFFIFDITVSDFGGYNILPHFIFGILLFSAVYHFARDKKTKNCLIIGVSLFSLISLVGYFLTVRFFDSYTYVDLAYSSVAKSEYLPIKILSVLETLLSFFLLISSEVSLFSFVEEHTDVAPSDPSYSMTNKRNHTATKKKTLPIFILAGIINLMKCANVFIKQTSTVIHSDISSEGITASAFPFMDTLIFFICVIYVIYTFVTVSNLKDEVRFKYGKE